MAQQVDVVVVGMGVGGEEVAGKLAEAGLSVVAVESTLVGGECPYWGCVPSKMMIRAANMLAEARRLDGMAGHADVTPEWKQVATRIREEATADWNDQAAVDRFTGKGGTLIRGRGRLAGSGVVVVKNEIFQARRGVVLATGTVPVVPPIDGLADTPYWTNREAIEAQTLPASLIVLGGGAVGLELAQVYARFGVAVTVVEAMDRLVPAEEPESSALVEQALVADGITVRVGAPAAAVRYDGTRFSVTVGEDELIAERLLVAVGRRADLTGLGLETVGLDETGSAIGVDGHMRAGDRLWAVGDVTGHGAFTHVGMYQAGIAIRDILGEPGPPADYRALPRVTFTDPEIGSVGHTEAGARAAGISAKIGMARTQHSTRGWVHKAGSEGLIKLVVDADNGVLVGATSAGPTGGEVLSALTVAVHARVPIDALRTMIYAYPTFHRTIEVALQQVT